jgi:transcriptional activator of cad operon
VVLNRQASDAMNSPAAEPLQIGDWRVDPLSSQMSRGSESVRLEARTLRLLLCLAQRPGQVVSIDELLDQVWSGLVVTPDSVYQAVTSLRRLLQDDARRPAYIATVPRQGYRLLARVSAFPGPTPDPPGQPTGSSSGEDSKAPAAALATPAPVASGAGASTRDPHATARRRVAIAAAAAATLCLALLLAVLAGRRTDSSNAAAVATRSVAVLPFLDLTTQAMTEEYFADGMTEELIDRLSKVPGLRVPPAMTSFRFKGRPIEVREFARSLRVAYVLDGSIRKSADTLRVATRLARADDGYVVWSETYERPLGDQLRMQDDIASEVAKAVSASIH